jgi:hypothetical protein
MANTYKILGQVNPTGGVETDLYTVPAATNTVVSCISICNFSDFSTLSNNSSSQFTITVSKAGAATSPKDIIYNSMPISKNDTSVINIGMTLDTGDVVRVKTESAYLSFNIFGTEIT